MLSRKDEKKLIEAVCFLRENGVEVSVAEKEDTGEGYLKFVGSYEQNTEVWKKIAEISEIFDRYKE